MFQQLVSHFENNLRPLFKSFSEDWKTIVRAEIYSGQRVIDEELRVSRRTAIALGVILLLVQAAFALLLTAAAMLMVRHLELTAETALALLALLMLLLAGAAAVFVRGEIKRGAALARNFLKPLNGKALWNKLNSSNKNGTYSDTI